MITNRHSKIELILERVNAWGLRCNLIPGQLEVLGQHRAALPDLAPDGSMQFETICMIAERLGDECGGGHLYERWVMNYVHAVHAYARMLWPVSAVYLVAYVYAVLQYHEPTDEHIDSMHRWENWARNGYEGPEPLS